MARSLLAAAVAAALLTSTAALAAQAVPAAITAAVNDASRPAADKERDANRKPAETVAFAGVKPGMTVAELGPGGGYYTRILAKAVGPKGKVLAIVGNAKSATRLDAVVKDNPNVTVVTATLPDIKLPEKADMFWTTENYHDFHNGPTANVPELDKAVFENLKPHGIFYVEDHSANPGAGAEVTSSLHRMDPTIAKKELETAGFKIEAEGDILKNPKDNKAAKNNEGGHFMTERFMFRAEKP
jgi:predicted methyltransferase